MKDKLWRLIRLLVILLGIGILIYPSLSQYLSEMNSSRATASYDRSVEQMEAEQLNELLMRAQEYNRRLAQSSAGVPPRNDEQGNPITPDDYWELLDVDGTGIIGYIYLPRFDTTIPIYHGTAEKVLQVGIGHLQNTSLPVGGSSTHAALSGHRGLPTHSLFTDLPQMQVGDSFFVKVLNQTLCYTVDQIQTVLPSEMNALTIEEGKDYMTLITCTPYGVNSHRLLVRGVRSPLHAEQLEQTDFQRGSFWSRLPAQYRHMLLGAGVIVGALILRFLVGWLLKLRKRG